jgi:DNA polymerase-3 subunit alpha
MPMQLSYEKEITGFYISGHPLDDYNQTMDRFCNIKIDELRNNMSKYKDHQVKFAGMITESAQKTSKRGDPFGTFMIEDFSGNLSLTLFSENYLKRKHMLDQGNNIFITGRVEERRHQPGIFQINITDIYLLSETMERLSKSIIIELKASDITESLSDDIIALCQTHTGSTPLKVRLYDSESKLDVTLKSGNAKVDPRMFYKAISENEKLKCKIS